ncbi:hypothetical protein BU17DRAFT_98212 [Hysterangium stoloniferum]|nr:hypothetical protein BU17DRAFT_98212 [Hysterangium stoloniferum]
MLSTAILVNLLTDLSGNSNLQKSLKHLPQTGLLEDIQLHVSISIVSTRSTLAAMEGNISLLMKMIFELLRSQGERDMDEFIKNHGGVEVVSRNPNLLDTLLRRLQRQAPDMPGKRQKDDSGMTVTKLQEQLRVDVEVIIKDNSKAFEQQCEVIQIDEVVKRASDRTIDTIREGAHDTIKHLSRIPLHLMVFGEVALS